MGWMSADEIVNGPPDAVNHDHDAAAGNVHDRHPFPRRRTKAYDEIRNRKDPICRSQRHTRGFAGSCHRFATSAPRYDYASTEQWVPSLLRLDCCRRNIPKYGSVTTGLRPSKPF